METRALVEDALDESLPEDRGRALDLHLSRCDGCRAFFAAEREEHRRWFQAMNDPGARRRLPDGFAKDFLSGMGNGNAVLQRRWSFVRLFRRIAAVVAAMLLFAGLSYAAVVGIIGGLGNDASEQEMSENNILEPVGILKGTSVTAEETQRDLEASGDGSSSVGETVSISRSSSQSTGGATMNRTRTASVALSAAILSTANAGLADSVTNMLVASDFAKKDSFTNAHCWSNVVSGVRGEDGAALDPTADYLVANKLYCCSPSKNSGTWVFPGRSLSIGDASSQGNFRTYCYRDAGLVFNFPGFFWVNGTFYTESADNAVQRLDGVTTVLAPSSKPFVIRPSYTNMTFQLDAELHGKSGSALDVYCPSGKEPFRVNVVNANSAYAGRIRVKCDRRSLLNGQPPVSLNLGGAPFGTVKVCAYSMLSPYVKTDAVTVNSLVLNDKAYLSIGASVEKLDDGSVSVANGRLVAEQVLSLPSGEGKVFLVLPEEAMTMAPTYRLPLLSAPSGSIDTSKFEVVPFSTGFAPPCSLEVETEDDVDTMYVVWDVVVKIKTDNGGIDKNNADSGLGKSDCWSDGLLPHGGANYVVSKMDGVPSHLRMMGSNPYVFPGKSLSIFPGCTNFFFISDVLVTNFTFLGGSTVTHARNMYLDIRGEKMELPSGEVYFETYDTHTIRLHAPLSGKGTAVIRGYGLTGSPKGNVRFEVANPDFKGTMHLTSQWIRKQGGTIRNRVFEEKPTWQTVVFAGPESLGSPLETFNPKAVIVDYCGELKFEKSMMFEDKTRGFCFGNVAQIYVPTGKTATFLSQWTLGGEVFVRSGGVVALGGDMRFANSNNIVDDPQSGKNLLTFPEGGSLQALVRGCIDGATVTFSNATSRLLLTADTGDLDLKTNGVKNVKTDIPFVFPGDSLNVEFVLSGTEPLSDKVRRLGLMTVSATAAESLRNRLYVNLPRTVLPKWMEKTIEESVDAETGDVTFFLSMKPVGFQVIIR